MRISVERRGIIRDVHYAARCDETGMTAYDKTRERALIRLVQMHAVNIAQLKRRLDGLTHELEAR